MHFRIALLLSASVCWSGATAATATTSTCTLTPTPAPTTTGYKCNVVGSASAKPDQIFKSASKNFHSCYSSCDQSPVCITISYNQTSGNCNLYNQPLRSIGFTANSASKVHFWNARGCFTPQSCTKPTSTSSSAPSSTPTGDGFYLAFNILYNNSGTAWDGTWATVSEGVFGSSSKPDMGFAVGSDNALYPFTYDSNGAPAYLGLSAQDPSNTGKTGLSLIQFLKPNPSAGKTIITNIDDDDFLLELALPNARCFTFICSDASGNLQPLECADQLNQACPFVNLDFKNYFALSSDPAVAAKAAS